LANIALAQGDLATMEKEESLGKAQPDLEWAAYYRHGDIAASHGHVRQAEEFYEKARQVGERVQVKSSEAFAVGERAWVQALSGKRKEAVASANQTLKIIQDYNLKLFAGNTLALAGESKKGLELAEEVAKSRPDDVLVQSLYVPEVRAAAALSSGDAAKAIEVLKPANAYDKAITSVPYIRGLAYWKAGLGRESAQEFQKILALRDGAPADPLMSFAHLGLGRAYALQGDSQKSRNAYQDFFALWKDADPDLPILKEAKAEYARLQ
jgi:tetratricopeptide (TPR) repeat protein